MKNIFLCLAITIIGFSSFSAQAETSRRPADNEKIVEKCSSAISAHAKRKYGNQSGALISTDSLTAFFVSNQEEGLRGRGSVKYTKFDDQPTYTFTCVLDNNQGKVTKLNIKYKEHNSQGAAPQRGGETNRKPNYDESTVEQCQMAINQKAQRKYGDQSSALINTDSLTAIFISNGEEGLRGNGSVKYTNLNYHPNYYFTCVVDTRQGKVTKLDIKFKP